MGLRRAIIDNILTGRGYSTKNDKLGSISQLMDFSQGFSIILRHFFIVNMKTKKILLYGFDFYHNL